MSLRIVTTPALVEVTTAYTEQGYEYDREGTTDSSAPYAVTAAVAVAQALDASVDRVELTTFVEDFQDELRYYRPVYGAILYRVGDGYEAMVDPNVNTSFPTPGLPLRYAGVGLQVEQSPSWLADPMDELTERLAALFPTYNSDPPIPTAGEVVPPDPSAFWTQFNKAVEVI